MFELFSPLATDLWPLLLLGLGLGLLHSLEADHVMAVSLLNNQNPSLRRTLSFAFYWALGHGGVLLCGGLLLLGIGVSIPDSLSFVAEVSVALLLIGLGVYLIWQLAVRRVRIGQHRHGDIVHTHLYTDEHDTDEHDISEHDDAFSASDAAHKHSVHQPMMVGIFHGLAGSAPALALIPAVASGQLLVGMAYLLLFSFGVIISMVVFGIGFTYIQGLLYRRYQTLFQYARGLLALGAIVAGSALLLRTL
ncbi:hypothetical protein ACVBE9_04555 [Eionea flava]